MKNGVPLQSHDGPPSEMRWEPPTGGVLNLAVRRLQLGLGNMIAELWHKVTLVKSVI